METAQSTTENLYYSNINNTRFAKASISGYPADTYTNPNDYVAKVRGDGQKIGPAMILKVMAGDKFNLRVNSWYKTYGANPGTPVSPFNDLLSILTNSIGGVTTTHGGPTTTELQNSGVLTPGVTSFLNSQTYNSSKPKAFINWIFLDEQFKYYAGSFDQVGNNEEFKTHLFNDVLVNKSGWLYVYVSNETPNIDVFFDNLQVTHIRGPLVNTESYYPYGMSMAGITYNALNFGSPESQKKKYNGIEKENDFGLEIYDAQLRELDGQTGRWWQIDPKTEDMEMWSPYASNYNNPILYSDPLGDEPESADGCCKWLMDGIKWVNNNLNPLVPLAELVTGKSLNSNFTESKSRTESAVQLGTFLVPTAKAETIIVNEVKNVVVGQVEKQIVKKTESTISSRAARREVMRKEGIPTSQQPKSQSKNTSGREYSYDVPKQGGGKQTKSVQQQTKDRNHSKPHWEAGKVKTDNGKVRMNNYNRPKLQNDKSKVEY